MAGIILAPALAAILVEMLTRSSTAAAAVFFLVLAVGAAGVLGRFRRN